MVAAGPAATAGQAEEMAASKRGEETAIADTVLKTAPERIAGSQKEQEVAAGSKTEKRAKVGLQDPWAGAIVFSLGLTSSNNGFCSECRSTVFASAFLSIVVLPAALL